MKVLYVNDTNAQDFNDKNKKHPVFAKYFSPTCPACIAMSDVWDETCKEVDEKYDTDMIWAQIDPAGISELANTDTYSDIAYVPALIVLKNGKKKLEYTGPKDKDKIIEFLVNNNLIEIKSNMRRGRKNNKSRKNKSRKNKSRKNKSRKNK
jgi:thiol-disulfide isomerase/thioredoxin